jgi:hypothetical protein
VPSDLIAAFDPEQGASLLGDKAHSMVFDNSKIRRLVPDFRRASPSAGPEISPGTTPTRPPGDRRPPG